MNNKHKNKPNAGNNNAGNGNNGNAESASEWQTSRENLLKVGITHGDTNGVGYELIFKTFADSAMYDICIPVVYGSSKIAVTHRKALEMNVPFEVIASANEAEPGCLNLLSCIDEEVKVDLGEISAEAGHAAFMALERAIDDLKAGRIDVLVTAPICKSAIHSAKFDFAGHTEFLADRLGTTGEAPLMILTNSLMRVALVTTHLPMQQVSSAITTEAVESKIRALYQSLRRDFMLSAPRIAVLGLNPHNGDEGMLGDEEKQIIAPAIANVVADGIPCHGPYSADGFFGSALYHSFDAVLAMYHDQGLAPFKALSMDDGVNFTAGLPYVRTSPDHGTAFDIAGKGQASPNSFRQAIYSAIDIYRNRMRYDEAYQDPLQKLYHERREDSDRQRHTVPQEKSE
ncbi:pyridoxal phosphate biosynthetic protein PdxA [gut metagenome]|uniref:Pyridoxal phosphate biosynthetic protein PdxA n=1 Tax=gut metagenome TaxID=749906 RepID=J9CXE9_9ZZZZ